MLLSILLQSAGAWFLRLWQAPIGLVKRLFPQDSRACVPVPAYIQAEAPQWVPSAPLVPAAPAAVVPVAVNMPAPIPPGDLGLEGQTERQRAYRLRLDEIRAALDLMPQDAGQRRRRRSRWGKHIPKLVFSMIVMIAGAPELFAQLPFSADELWADRVWIDEAGSQLVMLDGLRAELADTLLARKTRLYERTQTVLGVVKATLEMPVSTPEARRRMEQVSGDVRKLVEQRSKGRVLARKKKQAVLEQAAERVDQQDREIGRLQMENEILRTGTLSRGSSIEG